MTGLLSLVAFSTRKRTTDTCNHILDDFQCSLPFWSIFFTSCDKAIVPQNTFPNFDSASAKSRMALSEIALRAFLAA